MSNVAHKQLKLARMRDLEVQYQSENEFLLTEKIMNRLQFQREWFEFLERKNIRKTYPHPAVRIFEYEEIKEYFTDQWKCAWQKKEFPETFRELTTKNWAEMIERFLSMQIIPKEASAWKMPTDF